MRQRQPVRQRHRDRDFEVFVTGAAGRLLHAATLLTTEHPGRAPAAQRLLCHALAAAYARWDRPPGEDPYDRARQELAARFARSAWRFRRGRGGVLSPLTPRERLVVVWRLYEGVAEEQVAALLGLPVDRVRAICTRSVAALRGGRRRPAPAAPAGPVTP
ncbi:sigma factor-like helix-turn-helix DNA-binding protein [Streptomyces sp. SP18CS02]|uniref:sigma factor-like helix-turn-helix DNA-binding protein n=1 Tax=Streptomyces sp. SP18CS02 TaxID=3002531 RepID=UPI002E766FB4|nr:sigma factor-like helix-turn-helix DNA-binding protein [Streptomyces sp. SP18CS02]MEE1756251.1 sigma factor-like helix-turn-helix DNA-binding protein [Streptomyces sp. SP18CS02]